MREILAKWDLDGGSHRRGDRRAGVSRHRGRSRRRGVPGHPPRDRLPDVPPRGARERRRSRALRARDVARDRRARRGARPGVDARAAARVADDREQGWVYRQYDTTVRTNTVIGPGGDAAVRAPARHRQGASRSRPTATAATCYLDPRVGGRIAVAEAARNVACTGARPMAITNNLNFGNPKRPEVYFQLREAVARHGRGVPRARHAGHRRQRLALQREPERRDLPDAGRSAWSGWSSRSTHVTRADFQRAGDAIVLLGEPTDELGGSEYLARVHGVVAGAPPRVRPRRRARADRRAARGHRGRRGVARRTTAATAGSRSRSRSARMAKRERMLGADVDLSPWARCRARALLFGEAQGRVVVSTPMRRRVLAHRRRARRAGARDRHGARRRRGALAHPYAGGDARRAASAGSPPRTTTRSRRIMARVAASRGDARRRSTHRRLTLDSESAESCAASSAFTAIPTRPRVTHLGLYSLQHRGQESAGIVAVDDDGSARGDPRDGPRLRRASTDDAIGCARRRARDRAHALQHRRLVDASRTRSRCWRASRGGHIALAHNGNLTNADRAAARARGRGVDLRVDDGLRGHRAPHRAVARPTTPEERARRGAAGRRRRVLACSSSSATRWWRRAIRAAGARW